MMKSFAFLALALALNAAPPDNFEQLRAMFAKPPAEFSSAPLFVWNGEITEKELDLFLEDFKAKGIESFIIHPRPGLITEYMSDRWWTLVKHTVKKAKSLGMIVWLYDENSYPSGFAGGHVPAQMPESYNQGQGLFARKFAGDPPAGTKCEAAVKYEATTYCFEKTFEPKRAWHGGYSYVDLLVPGVTEKFIELTMTQGYEKAVGDEFGKIVPGIFTDEPHIRPPGPAGSIRWTPDLFEQFQKRRGYDLRQNLPSLVDTVGDWQKVRHDYYAVLLDLFVERWAKPWNKYCAEHNLKWTGHYWEHAWPNIAHGPDSMAMYAFHQTPAIDMLFNQFAEGPNAQFGNVRSVKELASVANQMGYRRTLSETYGGAGWEITYEDLKRLGDWQAVLGVNLMNQHLAWMTWAGARKHDYPQSFSYHNPWFKHYKWLGDYFARLSLAISSGEEVNEIAIVEPNEELWKVQGTPKAMEIGEQFQKYITALQYKQVEYDLASAWSMRNLKFNRQYERMVQPGEYPDLAPPPDIRDPQGSVFHHRRKLADGELLLFTNHSLEKPASVTWEPKGPNTYRLDLMSGRIETWSGTRVELPPAGSMLLYSGSSRAQAAAPVTPMRDVQAAPPASPLAVRRAGPNVLTLDYCDLTMDGATAEGLYYWVAADRLFRRHGFEGNPWDAAVQYKTKIVDRDKFGPETAFQVTYHFQAAAGAKPSSVVVERPHLWQVSINGRTVPPKPGAWMFERGFGVYDIAAHIVAGDNAIRLSAPKMSVHAEIEPVYVVGEFSVAAASKGFEIRPAAPLTTGSWRRQGLPFYPDAVVYSGDFKLAGRGARAAVRLGQWKGTVAEVRVNGRPAGIIGWQPYELEITDLVKPGVNQVEVLVTGSLKNRQGPHHGKPRPGMVGPGHFRRAPASQPPGSEYDMLDYGLMENFQVVEQR